jgi:hypothetical protein
MKHWSMREFTDALNQSAREFLIQRGVVASEVYQLQVEKCPIHGLDCVRVTYGIFRDHIFLRRTDPEKEAIRMIGTMLAPEPMADLTTDDSETSAEATSLANACSEGPEA